MELNQDTLYPTVTHIMEVTEFKDELTALAALETLKWLDEGAPHKFDGLPGIYTFDMEQFIYQETDDDGSSCGTACCIAGAMSIYKRHGEIEGTYNSPDALNLEFGTNQDFQETHELSKLFYPGRNGWVVNKTVGESANALRGYLFTGKTVWDE